MLFNLPNFRDDSISPYFKNLLVGGFRVELKLRLLFQEHHI